MMTEPALLKSEHRQMSEVQGLSRWFWWAALGLLVIVMLGLRVSAPSDIYDNEQVEPIGFVNDLILNDHYLTQWTIHTYKDGVRARPRPPLYTWIAAPFVKVFGYHEWAFKMPSILGALGSGLFVLLMARRMLGFQGGIIAAAFWFANYPVFKLSYTARSDMLLTMGMLMSLWALLLMREDWISHEGKEGRSPRFWKILVFWLGMTIGIMAKGPVAFLPVPFCWLIITIDRAWLRCGLVWHLVLGLLLPIGVFIGWFSAAFWLAGGDRDYGSGDLWFWQFNESYTDRISGTGTGAKRVGEWHERFKVPLYFLAYLGPWVVFLILGLISQRWRFGPVPEYASPAMEDFKEESYNEQGESVASHYFEDEMKQEGYPRIKPYTALWAVFWVCVVVGLFLIPASARADYIVSSLAGGAIFAALMVVSATRRQKYLAGDVSGWLRVIMIVMSAGFGLVTMIGMVPDVILVWFGAELKVIDQINAGALHTSVWLVSGGLMLMAAFMAGSYAFFRRYGAASMFLAFAMLMALGIYAHKFSPAATSWEGERQHQMVDVAQAEMSLYLKEKGIELPVIFYDTNYTAPMMLLGYNEWPVNELQFEKIPNNGVFLFMTSRRAWDYYQKNPSDALVKIEVLDETGPLKEAELELVLLKIEAKDATAESMKGFDWHSPYAGAKFESYLQRSIQPLAPRESD